ncbi:hypothetical protein GE061_014376 [Apolygus lucorum]|uniref:ubiquitinyl hydrolase 1 n=1 Tax=Apolygus lucorum TaxID=248454 RepID=A0A8S9XRR5_APOLU|nr:hypothetical protein GE061_014376 [Apolygus lucorum]
MSKKGFMEVELHGFYPRRNIFASGVGSCTEAVLSRVTFMDCDGVLSDPELGISNHDEKEDVTSPLFEPIATFDDVEIPLASDSMGLENTWDDEPMAMNSLAPPPSPQVFEYNNSCVDLALFSSADLEDPLAEGDSGEPGVCGLHNLGNTCFMSAGVQSLMATAPMVVSLVRTPIPPQHTLTQGLAELAKMIWTSETAVIRPTRFKESLVTHFPQFNDYRQHDCQEFLALLLDGLHEQMNTAAKKMTNVGDGGRESPDSASKIFAQMDDQFHPSTSHRYCNQMMGNVGISDTSDAPLKQEKDACDSRSTPEMNNVLNSKFLPRKENSETIACDSQLTNIFPSSMSGDCVHVMNNSLQQFSGLEDILKTPKTSNINVLMKQEEANNEIRFDSEKYPRRSIFDNPRRRGEHFNTNSFHLYENNTGGKRQKSSVTYFSCAADFKEGLDWKRVKLQSDEQDGKNKKMELERQNKAGEAMVLEKNQRLACEQLEASEGCSKDPDVSSSPNPKIADLKLLPAAENIGEEHWRTHLATNRSVIVDTFQGQFKSTVVCSSCNFVSVTYEPFMYLSVPLPNALQRQISVTFISCTSNEPVFCTIQVNQYDSVGTLKLQLLDKIDCDRTANLTIAEVLDHHVSKILDDSFLIRHLNDSDRRLYAFEVISPVEVERFEQSKDEEPAVDNSCTICLEEKIDMKQHEGCSCKLCDLCISTSCQHCSGTHFKCPVCRKDISPDVDLSPIQNYCQQSIRMIYVPVVFRVDKIGDGNNNQKSVELFGHPRLLRIPSTISSETLHALLKRFLPRSDQYKVLWVDGKGHNCSRCMYGDHCRGCAVQQDGDIDLKTSDTLAVAYSSNMNSVSDAYRSEVGAPVPPKPLTLYDCIQAFSKSEQLDGNNPWFCPRCDENRCATKTLTVWRCPDYLIVYLKRFVFRNSICTKLEEKVIFPLVGLSLPCSESSYDLYACVCHTGGVSAGHYTTYTQHPYTRQWHHFNDNKVTSQQPQEEDYHNAYILFYRKQGIKIPALNNEDMAMANNLD